MNFPLVPKLLRQEAYFTVWCENSVDPRKAGIAESRDRFSGVEFMHLECDDQKRSSDFLRKKTNPLRTILDPPLGRAWHFRDSMLCKHLLNSNAYVQSSNGLQSSLGETFPLLSLCVPSGSLKQSSNSRHRLLRSSITNDAFHLIH